MYNDAFRRVKQSVRIADAIAGSASSCAKFAAFSVLRHNQNTVRSGLPCLLVLASLLRLGLFGT